MHMSYEALPEVDRPALDIDESMSRNFVTHYLHHLHRLGYIFKSSDYTPTPKNARYTREWLTGSGREEFYQIGVASDCFTSQLDVLAERDNLGDTRRFHVSWHKNGIIDVDTSYYGITQPYQFVHGRVLQDGPVISAEQQKFWDASVNDCGNMTLERFQELGEILRGIPTPQA